MISFCLLNTSYMLYSLPQVSFPMKLLPSLVHVKTGSLYSLADIFLYLPPFTSSNNHHFVHCFYQFGFLKFCLWVTYGIYSSLFDLLHLVFNALNVCLYCHKWQTFILSHGWIIFHHICTFVSIFFMLSIYLLAYWHIYHYKICSRYLSISVSITYWSI